MENVQKSCDKVVEQEASNLKAEFQRSFNAANRGFSLVALFVNLVLLGIVGYLTTVIRANSEKVFADMGMNVPVLTAIVLAIPSSVCIMAIGIVGCLLAWMECAVSNQAARLSVHIMMAVLMLVFAAAYCLSLLMSMMSMMHSM